jgi:hypothetical protein
VELEEILAAEQEHLSAAEHWQQADLTPCENTSTVYQKVTVNFLDTEAVEAFFTLIGQAYTAHTNSIWFPPRLQRDLKHQRWAGDVS